MSEGEPAVATGGMVLFDCAGGSTGTGRLKLDWMRSRPPPIGSMPMPPMPGIGGSSAPARPELLPAPE